MQRSGSSGVAIKKWIGDHYKGKLPANWEKMTALQLKSLSSKGMLVKVKASYKLGEAMKKKPAAKKAAKPKAAKPKVRPCGASAWGDLLLWAVEHAAGECVNTNTCSFRYAA
jgi:histone H1/5